MTRRAGTGRQAGRCRHAGEGGRMQAEEGAWGGQKGVDKAALEERDDQEGAAARGQVMEVDYVRVYRVRE